MPILQFEDWSVMHSFIEVARASSTGLPDILIAQIVVHHNASPILTFDKKAAKLTAFKLLS